MDLTTRERELLEAARRNPYSREGQGTFLVVIGTVMVMSHAAGFWFDPRPGFWRDLSYALVWLLYGTAVWMHLRFEATAMTLVAKLDGSYADRVPPQPSALGLDRSDARTHDAP